MQRDIDISTHTHTHTHIYMYIHMYGDIYSKKYNNLGTISGADSVFFISFFLKLS